MKYELIISLSIFPEIIVLRSKYDINIENYDINIENLSFINYKNFIVKSKSLYEYIPIHDKC